MTISFVIDSFIIVIIIIITSGVYKSGSEIGDCCVVEKTKEMSGFMGPARLLHANNFFGCASEKSVLAGKV